MRKLFANWRGLLIIPVLAFAFAAVVPAAATFASDTACPTEPGSDLTISDGVSCAAGNQQPPKLFGPAGIFKKVTDVLLFIIGAVAVIMLVIGGIRYTISGGDQAQVKAAKDTILYAIIGIVIAILAYAIIGFVTGSFVQTS